MAIQNYSPENHTLIVGPTIIDDWNDLDVEYDDVRFKFHKGVYGNTTRTKVSSDFGSIVLSLPQTSEGNGISTIIHGLMSKPFGYGTTGFIPVMIRDNWNNTLHLITKATIEQLPAVKYGKDTGDLVWTFKGDFTVHVPGNILLPGLTGLGSPNINF